jgi:hypothetical protein
MNEYYIIQTAKYDNNRYKKINYYVSVINDNNNSINIGFGNYKSRPCIEILVYNDSPIAILNNVSNDIKCTIMNDFNINYQDIILLIKIALHFIINKYTYIQQIILNDNSTINCSNNIKISLADLSFIKYGKTWYEKNFNAIPDESNIDIIDVQKSIIHNRLNEKINMDSKKFISVNKEFLKKNNISQDKIEKILKKIKDIYHENISVYDYLQNFISEHIECLCYAYIFIYYMNRILYDTAWIIKKENIKSYEIKYSYLSTEKKASHEKIINRIKNFNKNNFPEMITYNYQKKYKNINYI